MESPLSPQKLEEFFEKIKKQVLEQYEHLLRSGACNEELHKEEPSLLITVATYRSISERIALWKKAYPPAKEEIDNLMHF